MTDAERQLEPVTGLLRRAVELDEKERVAARDAFLRRVQREGALPSRAKTIARYAVPLAIAAGVLLAILAWPSRQLDYSVEGAANEGGYVRAAHDRHADITFSDRTRIRALAQTRLRVEELGDNGARVSVERGRLEADVTHTGRGTWQFVAGPFQVRVTGTRFTLAWEADQEQLEVVMLEGAVAVEGYAGSGVVDVRAGQRFVGDAKRRTMLVSDANAEDARNAPPPSAGARSNGASLESPSPSSTRSSLASEPSGATLAAGPKVPWSKRVAKGEFQQVVEEATARGTRECLATCDPADLSALADAARYVGRTDLAEQALQALLTRDARASGGRAAYLLGRLSENKGDTTRARTWYERSLAEGRGGAFASEALAGKMRTMSAMEGRAAARPVAREYLRLYPKGVHAATARQLADGS